MHRRSSSPLFLVCIVAMLLAAPLRAAHAGVSLAASVGMGGQLSPHPGYEATNLMLAPGVDLLGIIRVELGIVGSWSAVGQVQNHSINTLDLELRPMLVISPPVLPLYARLIVAGVNLFSPARTVAYGGALGVGVSLFGLGVFAEAGILPRYVAPSFVWLLEGRAGLRYEF